MNLKRNAIKSGWHINIFAIKNGNLINLLENTRQLIDPITCRQSTYSQDILASLFNEGVVSQLTLIILRLRGDYNRISYSSSVSLLLFIQRLNTMPVTSLVVVGGKDPSARGCRGVDCGLLWLAMAGCPGS